MPPRLIRYRIHLESLCLAANTINQHLAAVRRLANEAADAGLLSPDLAAGIARVKGVKQLGQRSGNWLTQDQSADVLRRSRGETPRAKRDYAMLAMLFGCGLRRSELAGLEMDDIQTRQGHWAIVDLIGKGGHVRRFRFRIGQSEHWTSGSQRQELQKEESHDLRRTCAKLCHTNGGELEQIQFLLGHASVLTTERYLGCKQDLGHPVNDLFNLKTDVQTQEARLPELPPNLRR